MSVGSCIDAAVFDGKIGHKTADEAKKKFKDYGESFAADSRLSRAEWEIRSAQRVEAELVRDRARRKRMRTFQAAKQAELSQRIAAATAGEENKAVLAVLEFDPMLKYTGDNVVARHQSLRGKAWSLAADFIDTFRSRAGGLTRDTTQLGDVMKALFNETMDNPTAKALAEGVQEARMFLLRRHNSAGGDIKLRKDWGWVQKHDPDKMIAGTKIGAPERLAAKQQWTEFVYSRIDASKMYDPAGQLMTPRQISELLDHTWKELTLGQRVGDPSGEFTSPVNRRIAAREFAFKNSTAWMEYQEKYGNGNVLDAIIGELDKLARDTAIIEVLGPYPNATIQAMKDAVPDASKHAFIDAVWSNVSGSIGVPVHKGFAQWSQAYRNLGTAAKLGSAIFQSVPSDLGTALLTAHANGLPASKLMANYVKQMNPANPAHRKMAARLGYIAETWIGDLVGAQRLLGEVSQSAATAKFADIVLRVTGLSAHTEGMKNAFRLTFLAHMTEQAGNVWDKLPAQFRNAMERHGLTAKDWDLFRSTPLWTDPETGADFIRPEDVWLEFRDAPIRLSEEESKARFQAAQRIADMINAETTFAVVTPTARSRALTVNKTQAGTVWGEVARNFMLFRSWMAAFTYLHGARFRTIDGALNKVAYAGSLVIPMTLAGAFATQMSNISRGKDPLDMGTGSFWWQSVLRGGALGPFGDLLAQGQTRFGGGIIDALVGPMAQDIGALYSVASDAVKRDFSKLGSDTRRLVEGLLPGNSIWYTRLAFERMVKDQLELMVNPDVASQWRKAERKSQSEFKQRFYWKRGRFLPDRMPALGAIVGGS